MGKPTGAQREKRRQAKLLRQRQKKQDKKAKTAALDVVGRQFQEPWSLVTYPGGDFDSHDNGDFSGASCPAPHNSKPVEGSVPIQTSDAKKSKGCQFEPATTTLKDGRYVACIAVFSDINDPTSQGGMICRDMAFQTDEAAYARARDDLKAAMSLVSDSADVDQVARAFAAVGYSPLARNKVTLVDGD